VEKSVPSFAWGRLTFCTWAQFQWDLVGACGTLILGKACFSAIEMVSFDLYTGLQRMPR